MIHFPAQRRGPLSALSLRLLAALGLVFATVFVVWLDRDGYRDVDESGLSLLDCFYYVVVSLSTTGYGDSDLDDLADAGRLAAPTAWLFGSEAHGLPEELTAAADARVRVPLHGRAESLNLAAAAAVCLYSSARALRVPRGARETAGESASS